MIRRVCVCFIVCVVAGVASFAGASAGPDKPKSPSQEQVQQLIQRMEKLESRVAELEQIVPRIVTPSLGYPQLRVLPEGKLETLPKGWVPREFNGLRYYDIPLASERK